ncbi:MAG: zinc-dependent alcohol dehydrogenase [Planctomycetota bacterium]
MTSAKPKQVEAVAMTGPGAMELRSYPYPAIDEDSAVLKVEMCGVCGTDKHIFKGDATEIRGESIFPYIGGHEMIGTIAEIGPNAAQTMEYDHRRLQVGDRVAVAVEVNCGECWYCRNQYNNTTCENQVMAYGIHPGADVPPHLRGGFAEYAYVAPGSSLFAVPEGMSTEVAVFVEEMAVAYHSLARATGPFPAVKEGFGPGDTVAVLGNGPLGILHGIMASIHGAGMSIATDLADRRLEKAEELYADVTINASETPAEQRVHRAKELTHGVGPDLVIESAGVPEVFLEALEMVRKGGTVIEVGNWVDTGQTVPLNVMQHVASKNVHIHSVFHCGTNWGPVLRMMEAHADQFPFGSLISHRMGLEELAAEMSVVVDPDECMKVEVVPHQGQG